MSVTIFAGRHPENARLLKVQAVAALTNTKLVFAAPFVPYQDNEKEDFLNNCHPLGRMPVVQSEEGCIFESNSVLRYLVRRCEGRGAAATGPDAQLYQYLYGRTPFEASQVDQWLDFCLSEVEPKLVPYLLRHFCSIEASPETFAKVLSELDEALGGLQRWLENRTYLVGERLTIADVSVGFALQWVFKMLPKDDATALKNKYNNVWRLYLTVMHVPKIAALLKEEGTTLAQL